MDKIPTYQDFLRGLRSNSLSDLDLDVLDCFMKAEAFRLTSTELASELGSSSYEYGNLRIGALGRNLADAMSFTPNLRASNRSNMYWNVVASGHNREGDGQFVYTLHPDLLAALQQFPQDRTGRRDTSATPRDELPELTDEQRDRIARRREQRRRDGGTP